MVYLQGERPKVAMRRLQSDRPPRCLTIVAAMVAFYPQVVSADGTVVDRIYDPYVQPLETELEYRAIIESDDVQGDRQKHSFGFGRSLSDRWATEFYAIGTNDRDSNFSIDTYELEVKWQLTEQGEFAFDWGMVFELEREIDENAWELSTKLISSRDFGKWTGVANLGVIYEWGRGIENEFETELRMQARYRLKEALEPAIELHMGQDTVALGPALTGLFRLSPGKKLRWEVGVFFGADSVSPEQTFRANLEFEF